MPLYQPVPAHNFPQNPADPGPIRAGSGGGTVLRGSAGGVVGECVHEGSGTAEN